MSSNDDSPELSGTIWGPLLVCALLAGAALGCFAVAATAQAAAVDHTEIITVTLREGVMTERLRTGVMSDRVCPESVILATTKR